MSRRRLNETASDRKVMTMRSIPLLAGLLALAGCAVEDPASPSVAEKPATAAAPKPVEKKPAEKKPLPGRVTNVDLGRLIELRDDGKVLLIDVRPSLFFGMGHIPGALSLPKKSFESAWPGKKAQVDAAVAAGKVVVVYCANEQCPDGYAVAKKMAPMGYDVSIYKGGWEEWKMTGFE